MQAPEFPTVKAWVWQVRVPSRKGGSLGNGQDGACQKENRDSGRTSTRCPDAVGWGAGERALVSGASGAQARQRLGEGCAFSSSPKDGGETPGLGRVPARVPAHEGALASSRPPAAQSLGPTAQQLGSAQGRVRWSGRASSGSSSQRPCWLHLVET